MPSRGVHDMQFARHRTLREGVAEWIGPAGKVDGV
jgi:hypothetical protein